MVLLWSVVAALVLVVVGIFTALVIMGRISLFPVAEPVETPMPEETGIVDTTYSVMVLNATPEAGLEDQMRDELINAGWDGSIVFAVDGASNNFETTTVYYVDPADEDAAIGLAGVIGGANVEQNDFYAGLNKTGVSQLTVVIGLDRSTVEPEPEQAPAE